jgi:oxalate decarboxylase
MREPHWHPTAWELNYIISGTATWTILGTHPDGRYRRDVFQAHQGDLVFVPQGFFHFFGNAATDTPLQVLIVFNTSAQEPNDDIGIVAALNSIPREILAAAFGVPVSAFDRIPTDIKPVIITKRNM